MRCFHWENVLSFTAEERRLKSKNDPFWRVTAGYCDKLAANFFDYYQPGQMMDIDEMAIYFKGRHKCRCYNPNKPEKWHFKAYCLNDAETGYLLHFKLYAGKSEVRPNGMSATA